MNKIRVSIKKSVLSRPFTSRTMQKDKLNATIRYVATIVCGLFFGIAGLILSGAATIAYDAVILWAISHEESKSERTYEKMYDKELYASMRQSCQDMLDLIESAKNAVDNVAS